MSEQRFACRLGFIMLSCSKVIVFHLFGFRELLVDANDQTTFTKRQAKSLLKIWDFYSHDCLSVPGKCHMYNQSSQKHFHENCLFLSYCTPPAWLFTIKSVFSRLRNHDQTVPVQTAVRKWKASWAGQVALPRKHQKGFAICLIFFQTQTSIG